MIEANNFIRENASKGNEFDDLWSEISNLYSKKLWHQMTLFIEKLLNKEEFRNTCDLRKLYESLISSFENKMNSLSLARIAIIISHQIMMKENPEKAIEFLNKIILKISGVNTKEASVLLLTEIGLIYLYKLNDMINAREIRDKADNILNEIDGVCSAHAPFYKLSSAYYSVLKNYSAYYREALKYLGCLNEEQLKEVPVQEKQEWAAKLCVSALLGHDIYNFGELLMHEIVDYISPENQYLVDLVKCFNSGDLKRVNTMFSSIQSQPDLAKEMDFLREKITLMCLVETIFQRPVNQRSIKFGEISEATNVQIKDVELMIMKAMSKGLIEGLIDDGNQELEVKWVQPRVLNPNQILKAQTNIKSWTSCVNEMIELINSSAQEIIG